MPKVSVITPTYNRASLIGQTIESVLHQTYQNFEFIIIDDGSTDNTEEVVNRYQDPRIVFVKQQSNGGAPAARNAGIKIACGQYIAFIDSDDLWLPTKLAVQVRYLDTHPEFGVAYSDFYRFEYGADGKRKKWCFGVRGATGNIFAQLYEDGFVGCLTVMVRRECLQAVGLFDEELWRAEDYELWLRLAVRHQFAFIPQLLAEYRVHSGEASVEKLDHRRWILRALEKTDAINPQLIKSLGLKRRQRHGSLRYSLGVLSLCSGNLEQARKCFRESLRWWPFHLLALISLIFVLFGWPGVRSLGWTNQAAKYIFTGLVRKPHTLRMGLSDGGYWGK